VHVASPARRDGLGHPGRREDCYGGTVLVSGHQEARCDTDLAGRDASHGGHRYGDQDHTYPEAEGAQAREEVAGAVGIAAGGGQKQGRSDGKEQAGGGGGARGEVGEQVAGDQRAEGDGEREGQERESGAERAEAEDRLQEDRGQEEVPTSVPVTPIMTAVRRELAL
jgi:hypothetical protein